MFFTFPSPPFNMDSILCYFFAAVSALIMISYYTSRRKLGYWKRLAVHSLPTHWLFGNMKDAILMKHSAAIVIGHLHLQGAEEGRKPEDLLGFYILWKPFLLVRNPELIKQILVKDFKVFSDRYFATKTKNDIIGTKNLFSVDNPEWKFLRQKMTTIFSTGKIKKFFHLIMENTAEMRNFIDQQLSNDSHRVKAICVTDLSRKYATDVISSLAFGVKTNSFGPHAEFYNQSMNVSRLKFLATFRLLLVFFFPWAAGYAGASMLGDSADYFRKVFWESMNERERSGVKRGDLIDSLLQLKNAPQDEQFGFQGDVLLAQSAVFFVAGLESTAATVTFALYEIAKRPDIQDRVRREIEKEIGKVPQRHFTYDSIQQMKYLHQVVSEVLRMYPAAPIIDRLSSEDYQIPGRQTVIKKGTPVYVSLWGLHYDPKYYENPSYFNPERFSEENKANIIPYTYMPFGEGPRSCIAMRLGLLQTTAALVSILANYQVSLNPLSNIQVHKRSIFLRPSSDLFLNFRKITADREFCNHSV